jgi:hypothetical protein
VEKPQSFGDSRVAFADFVDPAALDPNSRLATLLPGRVFLTKYRETVVPEQAGDDFTFTFAASDEVYHETVTRTEYVDATGPLALAGLALCGLACLGGLVVLGVVFGLRRSARAR